MTRELINQVLFLQVQQEYVTRTLGVQPWRQTMLKLNVKGLKDETKYINAEMLGLLLPYPRFCLPGPS